MNTFIQNKHNIQNLLSVAEIDLFMATKVQKSFLPQVTPIDDEWDIAFYTQPMSDVSGDFYDFYIIDNKLSGLGIFDVSGHGIGPCDHDCQIAVFQNLQRSCRFKYREHL